MYFYFPVSFISYSLLYKSYSCLCSYSHYLYGDGIFLPAFQGDECILRAVPDHCARGTLQHLPVSAAHFRGVLPAAGFGSALRSAQPNHHNHDRRGYRGCHDTVGHRLQRSGPYQSGHGKNMMWG